MSSQLPPRDAEPSPDEPTAKANPIGTFFTRLALAGVGAASMAQEEIEGMVRKLIERGDLPADRHDEFVEQVTQEREKERSKTMAHVDATVQRVLRSINLPTSDDVDALDAQLDDLLRRADALIDART